MTIRQKLEQYRSLKQEIKNLERRIAEMQTRTIASVDIVKMSDAEYPYIEHNSSVIGYCTNNFSKDVVRQYKSRLARAKELFGEIDKFIDGIDDSEMRELITLRYVDGLAWRDIPQRLGLEGSGTTELQKIYRFLRNDNNNDLGEPI